MTRRVARAAGAVAALLASTTRGAALGPPIELWGPLQPGTHAIGFRVLNAKDQSRRLPGTNAARPLQISVWYPARDGSPPPMTYGDYVLLGASEKTLVPPSPAESEETFAAYRRFLGGVGAPAGAIDDWLGARMAARRDGEPARGRFPLIVVAQGNGGAAPDHALLAEYLASHGYVVATSPSQARLGDSMNRDADILPSAMAQARDLAFVVRELRSFPTADAGPLGLVGYSFGGRSALLLAGREPRVQAFVSLDSGIAAKAGRDWLPRGGWDASAVRTPILHLFQDREDFVTPDLGLLARLKKSDRRLLRISDMGHFDFITYGMASAVVPELAPEAGPRRVARKVQAVFAYVEAFLDAALKNDAEGSRFLDRSPEENGLPPGLLTRARMKPVS